MAGLTPQGFTPKSLDDIRNDIGDKLKLAFGDSIDVSPTSRVGQFIDIISNEISSAWEALQADYNSRYPSTSIGVGLDNVVEITNTRRIPGYAAQAKVYLAGDASSLVGEGTRIAKTGTEYQFFTLNAATISDQCNIVICDAVPNEGTITLSYQDIEIDPIDFDEDATSIKAKLEAHPNITTCEVKGKFSGVGSIQIRLITFDLVDTELKIEESSFKRFGVVTDNNAYFCTEYETEVLSVDNEKITVPQISLTTIVNTVTGLDAVINFDTGISGASSETDAELRERRTLELQKQGTTTLGGIKQAIQAVDLVTSVTIVQNDSVVEVDGRQAHSYECYVIGGDDNAVAQTIYDSKPPGVAVVSTASGDSKREGVITNVNGDEETIVYSKPLNVPIMVVVNITKDSTYEQESAEAAIKQNLTNYVETLELGQDVLTYKLISVVAPVSGIVDLEILTDTVDGNSPDEDNVIIGSQEIATLINANIVIVAV